MTKRDLLPVLCYTEVADSPCSEAFPPLSGIQPGRCAVSVNVDALVTSRLLIQANSGAGKSRAIRQLLEETHGKLPHLVFDPEGEFATLRSDFPYVLAAVRGGDVEANPKTAGMLCRKLMTLRASAVLDLYDLPLADRRLFVHRFLTELMALPRTLWRPTLVVIDEAHVYAPERGSGESISTDAVITLCTQGRKRGYTAVLATQRLSKLHKDAAAELLNKLVGRTGLDVDVKRAGDDLGFDKEQRSALKTLQPGQFYAYGPAIANEVTLVRTSPTLRTLHPEAAGQLGAAPPPTPVALASIVAALGDLPREAADEARSVEALRALVRDLERRVHAKPKVGPTPEEIAAQTAVVRDMENRLARAMNAEGQLRAKLVSTSAALDGLAAELRAVPDAITFAKSLTVTGAMSGRGAHLLVCDDPVKHTSEAEAHVLRRNTVKWLKSTKFPRTTESSNGTLPKGERAVLIAVAQHGEVDREQLTVLTGYKRSSRDTYLQRLRERGYITIENSTIAVTDSGTEALGDGFEPLPTGRALQQYWMGRLTGGERVILGVVCEAWPHPVTRTDISHQTEYQRSSRDTYLQRLASRKLVVSNHSGVRASDLLFDERR